MKVPPFDVPGLTRFLVDMAQEIERHRRLHLSTVTANASLLLQSPAGKVYEVKVDDAGSLFLTLISDTAP